MTNDLRERLERRIDQKTKPRGALGRLESLARQLGEVQRTTAPVLRRPTIVVFAADHGISREPVSAYPREVTPQMALNILAGGAGINVFARQHGIEVVLVDAGVDWPGERPAGLVDHWIGPGTANYAEGDAMTDDELRRCLAAGAEVVAALPADCTVVGFGELGIGNTSSASLLMSALCELPIAECVGPGSGLSGDGLRRKVRVLRDAQAAHPQPRDPHEALRMFGGFEIAQMSAAMESAAERDLVLLIDGFVAGAAYLVAWIRNPAIADHAVFCHRSAEPAHARLLGHLGAEPLLSLGLRLGEGSGCAIAYPILVSAVAFLDEMASFADAGVSTGEPEKSTQ